MSLNKDAAYYDANSGTKVTIDPEVLKKVFGDPKDSEKRDETHTVNERVGDNYATNNSTLPLLSTSNAQSNSKPDPEVDDHAKNSIPKTDPGPRLPTDDLNNNSAEGVKIDRLTVPQAKPAGQPDDESNDHFQWWSNEDDQDAGGLESRFGEGVDPLSVPTATVPTATGKPDVNAYQQRKNLAHGMMDLALLSANATQLRSIIEAASHPYFYPGVVFVSLSIILQVTVGILLILNSRYDVTKKSEIQNAIRVNDFTVTGVFLVTIINVFIASFIGTSPTTAPAQQAG